jgi:uncharacterized membrane protein
MGATWARFAFAAPMVALALGLWLALTGQSMPSPTPAFWAYAVSGAMAQMLATACVVALFGRRNFAVGVTLSKTEVILTALIGLIVLGEAVSAPVLMAIGVGFVGVILLSDPPKGAEALPWRARIFNAASGYGLMSGLLFGVSAVTYRGATLSLTGGDEVLRAATALLTATFAAGATDYSTVIEATRPAASNVFSVAGTANGIALSASADTTNTAISINGSVEFFIGDGTRQPSFRGESATLEDPIASLALHRVYGLRSAGAAINAIRLIMSAGTISIGTFRLVAVR